MKTRLREIDLKPWHRGAVIEGPLPSRPDDWYKVTTCLLSFERDTVKEADDFIIRITTVFP